MGCRIRNMASQAERLKSECQARPRSRVPALFGSASRSTRRRWREFLHEVRVEMRQVTWPTRHEVVVTTFVVIVAVAFFGLFFFGVDSTRGLGAQPRVQLFQALRLSVQMAKQWYIIHTYSGFEKKVKESLEGRVAAFGLGERIGRVMIPDRGRRGSARRQESRFAANVLSRLRAGGNGDGRRHLARGAVHAARHRICRFGADAVAAERRGSARISSTA